MTFLSSTYECKLDSKGRVLLPAGLKKELSPVLNEGFVLKPGIFNKCLELYPNGEWLKELENINRLNRFEEENQDFIRVHTGRVKYLELDNSGRILIPRELMLIANIEKIIVMASQINKLEIWDKKGYDKKMEESLLNYANLARNVMTTVNKPGQ